jgi:hypothetical protein
MFQLRDRLRFCQIGFRLFCVRYQVLMRNLDCHSSLQLIVEREIHQPEATAPQFSFDPVPANSIRKRPFLDDNRLSVQADCYFVI